MRLAQRRDGRRQVRDRPGRACAARRRPARRSRPGSPRGALGRAARRRRRPVRGVQRASSTSGAPLVISTHAAGVLRVGVRSAHQLALRGERHSRRRARSARRGVRASRPAFSAATFSAPSVGSPSTDQRPSRSSTRRCWQASRGAAPARLPRAAGPSSSGSSAGLQLAVRRVARAGQVDAAAGVTQRAHRHLVRVSVPVLSVQMTVAEPSVSTAASLRTIALRLAMRCMPSDSTTVVTAGSPSGTAATASETV